MSTWNSVSSPGSDDPNFSCFPLDQGDFVNERPDEPPDRRCAGCSTAFPESDGPDEEYHRFCGICRETGAVRRPIESPLKQMPQKLPDPKHGFRYPGGKSKLLDKIMPILREMAADLGEVFEYREPFLGCGSVALAVVKERLTGRAWLNDCDPSLAAYWGAVLKDADNFNLFIDLFNEAAWRFPDTDYHHIYKRTLKKKSNESDFGDHSPDFIGFLKLMCHLLSFSGLGTAGGRLPDPYSRFHCDTLKKHVQALNRLLSDIEIREQTCTTCDFEALFAPGEALFYLDPPYYQAGPSLYQFSFSAEDHVRLARILRSEDRPWLLSYDRHPAILDLYGGGWAHVREVEVGCSINGCAKKTELLISNSRFEA